MTLTRCRTPAVASVRPQGYLLGPFGLGGKDGAWAYANLGVLVALVVGFVATLVLAPARIRRQEPAEPVDAGRPAV